MAIGVAIGILILALVAAYQLCVHKSKKRKYIIWGITIMVAIAPFLSWLVGISYGISVGSGFAGAALMVIMSSIIFLVGLITLLMGIFKNEKTEI